MIENAPEGGRSVSLRDGRRVAVLPVNQVMECLQRAGIETVDLEATTIALYERRRGRYTAAQVLMGAARELAGVSSVLGLRVLHDWPYANKKQRITCFYDSSWVEPGERLPWFGLAVGWNWGTEFDGNASGNDRTRPWISVVVLEDRVRESVFRQLSPSRVPQRRMQTATAFYPSWFYLPSSPQPSFELIAEGLADAASIWAPVLSRLAGEFLSERRPSPLGLARTRAKRGTADGDVVEFRFGGASTSKG